MLDTSTPGQKWDFVRIFIISQWNKNRNKINHMEDAKYIFLICVTIMTKIINKL